MFETPTSVFIFDKPFIMRWVNIHFLFRLYAVHEILGWMRNSYTKFQFSDRTVCNYVTNYFNQLKILTISVENKILVNNVAPCSLQLSEENLYLNCFITFNSGLLLKSAFLYQQKKFYGQIFSCVFMFSKLRWDPLYKPWFVDTLHDSTSFHRLTSLIGLKCSQLPLNFILNIFTLTGHV